ncbi:MAG: hypothetical protein IJX64_01785 [Clostridia bacterium]|nr:hypothetical protein [Clostridia bacterium]
MSIDYYAYIKDIANFSVAELAAYAATVGVDLRVEEDLNLLEAEGFQPFHLRVGFIDGIAPEQTFLSGFELYTSEYVHEPPAPVQLRFWQKLLGKKPLAPAPNPFSAAVADAKYCAAMCCSGADHFEPLLAYIFGAYVCKFCGGVLDDPQTGCYYDHVGQIESGIFAMQAELNREAQSGDLQVHPLENEEE